MNTDNASRRQFLLGSLSGLGTAWLAPRWPAIRAAQEHAQRAAESGKPAEFQFFSPLQAGEIDAVAAQIIPSDDTPGAREARVIYFIDRALTTFDRDKQPAYTHGLEYLRKRVEELVPGVNRLTSLTPAQQIQVLTAIEKTEFFELVRVHTIMGFLATPDYGGNYDQVGWKLIGFEDEMIYKPPFGYYDREYNKRR
jgi:gluconate 2-dehydrogenase gamma chain